MKTKKKLLVLITIMAFILIVISIFKGNKIMSNIKTETKEFSETNPLEGVYLRIISERKVGEHLWRPTLENGYVGYCIEPGAPLGNSVYTREDILADVGKTSSSPHGCALNPVTNVPIGTYSSSYLVPSANEKVYTQNDTYGIEGKLYDVGYILSYSKLGIAGTSVEATSDGEWNDVVQNAIWRSPICEKDATDVKAEKGNATGCEYGILITRESKEYKKFYTEMVSKKGSSEAEPSIEPVDQTNKDENGNAKVTVSADNTNNKVTIGPFNVNYTDYRCEGNILKFGGISDMYLVDEAGNRIDITELSMKDHKLYADEYNNYHNINSANVNNFSQAEVNNFTDSEKFIYYKWKYVMSKQGETLGKNVSFDTYLKSVGFEPHTKTSGKPNYFSVDGNKTIKEIEDSGSTPKTYNENLVDYWDFARYYPSSGEDFYISYAASSQENIVGSVHLHIDFAFVKCEASFLLRKSYKFCTLVEEKDTPHCCHSCNDKNCTHHCNGNCCHSCEKWTILHDEPTQDCVIAIPTPLRTLIRDKLDIYYNKGEESFDTTMKLGGYVFNDLGIGENKESLGNGTLDLKSTENTQKDNLLPNVQVTLYECNDDGSTQEAKCKTLLATKFSIDMNKFVDKYNEETNETKTADELSYLYQYDTTASIKIAETYAKVNNINIQSVSVDEARIQTLKNDNDKYNKDIEQLEKEINENNDKYYIKNMSEGGNYNTELISEIDSYTKIYEELQNKLAAVNAKINTSNESSLRNSVSREFRYVSQSTVNELIDNMLRKVGYDYNIVNTTEESNAKWDGMVEDIVEDLQDESREYARYHELHYYEGNTSSCINTINQLAYLKVREEINEAITKTQVTLSNYQQTKDQLDSINSEYNKKIEELNGYIDANNNEIQSIINQKNLNNEAETQDAISSELSSLLVLSNTSEDYSRRINSTLTDENGYYEFRGLVLNKKYFVKFTYNGQDYIPTDYLAYEKNTSGGEQYKSVEDMAINNGIYSSGTDSDGEYVQWQLTSKGTEYDSTRNNKYDSKFAKIGSSPHNYVSSNSLDYLKDMGERYFEKEENDSKYYNETYTELKLMGYELQENGIYKYDDTKQLIDGYKYETDSEGYLKEDDNGNYILTNEYSTGVITKAIQKYIEDYKSYPNDIKTNIYDPIISDEKDENSQKTLKKELQFIEDCKINSWTKAPTNNNPNDILDLYPVYDKFTTSNNDITTYDGTTYKTIYKGQLEINQGLWKRQVADVSLQKDLFMAALKINGKTEVYKYHSEDEDNKYWNIASRLKDSTYYTTAYSRKLYKSDYYAVDDPDISNKLDIYVTYRIVIHNQSESELTQIPEVVDYFDKDYTYREDLSWVMYHEKAGENAAAKITEDEYYNMMSKNANLSTKNKIEEKENGSGDITLLGHTEENKADKVVANKANGNINNINKSVYGDNTREDIDTDSTSGYNAVYVNGLVSKKLESGQSEYVYLTFEVNNDNNNKYLTIENQENDSKKNIAEINGYNTYYKDGKKLPNGVTKNSGDVAGLIDVDSNPGNLTLSDLNGEKYEKNFEDDTDRAKGFRITLSDDIRKLSGTVWEDKRSESAEENAQIGDGLEETEEKKIAGITVYLYEVVTDQNGKQQAKEQPTCEYESNEWKSKIATTDENGHYEFSGYIPGDYIVRFEYGKNDNTALTNTGNEVNEKLNSKGANEKSYNGNDYKSTVYQTGVDNKDSEYRDSAYSDTESCTYKYDIAKADEADKNNIISDAKDIMSIRKTVDSYSNSNVTNHKAEVLASPYKLPSYNENAYAKDEMKGLIDELEDNTGMTAETGIIDVEGEYNRKTTEIDGKSNNTDDKKYVKDNDKNGNYVLQNVNLGLEQRPQAQLKTTKQVVNVKVTLANGNILFDATNKAANVLWQKHIAHQEDKANTYKKDDNYVNNIMSESSVRATAKDKGEIQLTMDEELMQGATIKITYAIFIANTGEVNYCDESDQKNDDGTKTTTYTEDNKFYYTGEKSDNAKIVTTTANTIIDYVGYQTGDNNKVTRNNLLFNASENSDWEVITAENLTNTTDTTYRLVNSNLKDQAKEYNTIIKVKNNYDTSQKIYRPLIPIIADQTNATSIKGELENNPLGAVNTANNTQSVAAIDLVLSKTISSDTSSDDMTYNNMTEIVSTSNTVGRRMAYSVVGNQDPTAEPAEIDADDAQEVTILPPFGQRYYVYYILGIGILIIMSTGIILIKKKVL